MNIEVFLQIFLWFKFGTSVQICIYLPTFVLIYTLCNRCCPTERYIRTVRIPGDLCSVGDTVPFISISFFVSTVSYCIGKIAVNIILSFLFFKRTYSIFKQKLSMFYKYAPNHQLVLESGPTEQRNLWLMET